MSEPYIKISDEVAQRTHTCSDGTVGYIYCPYIPYSFFANTIQNDDFNDIFWPHEIDLIVTSPPYKDEDNYTPELITQFAEKAYKHLKDDSLMFMNFGHLANFKSRPFEAAMLTQDAGFNWIDTITWVKNHYRPLQGKRRVNNLTEFIFMFGKGNPSIDRLSIGIPYADKSNATRWKGAKGKDLKCAGNVWNIPYDTVTDKSQKLHNDRFPVGLPEMCIKLSGIAENSLVVDPFMGSGTTAVAAQNLKMKYWGTEKSKEHYKTIKKRLAS